MLPEKTTAHIRRLAEKSEYIRAQFFASEIEEETGIHEEDPFFEVKNTKVKGLVHKYKNRALILLTRECAAYCRFCTRRRTVSDLEKGHITRKDIDKIEEYLKEHTEIEDLIFSGGDPLTAPNLLLYAIKKFSSCPQIKIFRIDTRLPVVDPNKLTDELIKKLSKFNQKIPIYFVIHFEHPDELSKETINLLNKLRLTGFPMLSQSVFLKGINDNFETLYTLFQSLIAHGVRPYYIYRCDNLIGTKHFIVPLEKEIEIMTKLRNNLSGIAYPLHIICVPQGYGKVPVPTGHWAFDKRSYRDFYDSTKKTNKVA